VRPILWRALRLGAIVSAAAGAIAIFSHGLRAVVFDAWLLAIGAVVLHALFRVVRLLAPRAPSPLEEAAKRMRPAVPSGPELALEREILLSLANEFHFHIRLRPVLREIAAHRLRSRYGVDLDREAARARELVPARVWEVVDPNRRPPGDRLARGPTVQSLNALVDELERL
jgi:hypothetical protein